jgi:C4-dicarboxylate transporter
MQTQQQQQQLGVPVVSHHCLQQPAMHLCSRWPLKLLQVLPAVQVLRCLLGSVLVPGTGLPSLLLLLTLLPLMLLQGLRLCLAVVATAVLELALGLAQQQQQWQG